MKNTEHFRALRALLAASEKGLDQSATHDGLTNCKTIVKARAALEELESAPDPIEILENVREWTLGDLDAAEMSGEEKTEIDADTLRARVAALYVTEKTE
jgi:hypothetical protein